MCILVPKVLMDVKKQRQELSRRSGLEVEDKGANEKEACLLQPLLIYSGVTQLCSAKSHIYICMTSLTDTISDI